MRRFKKAFLAVLLGTAIVAGPAVAHAGYWRGPYRGYHHHHAHVPAPLIGLGIAGAIIGTVATVDALVRPRVYYAPPPPPPYYRYDDAYRRGYDDGRRDGYDDRNRYRD